MATVKRCLPFAAVGVASAWLASTISAAGDWPEDSRPAVEALAHGHIVGYLSAKAMMGPFATLIQAPFVALGGPGAVDEYRLGSLPCLLAVGLAGLHLARIAGRRGAGRPARFMLAALCLVNPLTLEALRMGHPEELLTAALAVAAVASAAEGRTWRTAILLGLAVASKQWAVVAVLPALMALPGRRLRAGVGAVAIAGLFVLPSVLVAPGSFLEIQSNAASTGTVVTPWSVWYPLAHVVTARYRVGSTSLSAQVHESPWLVGALSHPLIVLLCVAVPLALALRRGRFGLTGSEAMAVLALLSLMRCALDPVNNLYYSEPLLLALLGWDAFAPDRLPLRGLAAAGAALILSSWAHSVADFAAFNAGYIAACAASGLAVTFALLEMRRTLPGSPRAQPPGRLSYPR